ncbi:PLC-like phosphodiesterase [Mycena pura]|uniref:PLC-like phosphodiesterase n=1 Tax=Mycena pura TaxID=153505 RepID=A0AAD6YM09_9AGAR|nr:PLC-like phosphodiesterase [Mycena pura]
MLTGAIRLALFAPIVLSLSTQGLRIPGLSLLFDAVDIAVTAHDRTLLTEQIALTNEVPFDALRDENIDLGYGATLDLINANAAWVPAPSNGKTNFAPALAAHRGRLYSVYADPADGRLHYSTGDNVAWDQFTISLNNEYAQDGPALADLHGTLHLVFPDKISGMLVHLHVGEWSPDSGWRSFHKLGNESTAGTLSLYTDATATTLFLLFAANSTDRKIVEMSSRSVNGVWSHVTPPDESTAFGTAATNFRDTAMMAFPSNDGQSQVCVSFYDPGLKHWLPHEPIVGEFSSHAPAIAVLDGVVNVIFPLRNSVTVFRVTRNLLSWPLDSWMNHLNSNLYMSQLSLPGTHDSGSVTSIPYTETQFLSITQQLDAGIRVFDLRCGLIRDVLWMVHGDAPIFTTLQQLLHEMYNWLLSANHQGEALVVSIKQDADTHFSNIEFDQAVYEVLQLGEQKQYWVTNATIPQLGQVRGKIQLLRRYSAGYNTTTSTDYRIGIDASGWPNNTPLGNITIPGVGTLWIEDHYNYDDVSDFADVVANKTGYVEAALAFAVFGGVPNNWHISFTTASNFPYHQPSGIALGGVNLVYPFEYVVGVNFNLVAYIIPMLRPGASAI